MKLLIALMISTWLGALSPATQTLRWGNKVEPQDLDPHRITGHPEINIAMQLFEPLVSYPQVDGDPLPGVAEKWTASADYKLWTFELRRNAKWTNGETVKASDFVYSWRRLADPKTAAELSSSLYYVKNAQQLNSGKMKDLTQLGIKAEGDFKLVVELEHPYAYFPQIICSPIFAPLPEKTITKFGTKWTRPENFVSNGAFQLKEWKPYNKIVMVPNPHYWDRATVKLTEVEVLPVESGDTEERMFRAKQIDITSTVPNEKIDYWRKQGAVFQNGPLLAVSYYRINNLRGPFKDKRVRRALALAVNRTQITDMVIKGGQKPLGRFLRPRSGVPGPSNELPLNEPNLAEAKKLLAEAGYPDPTKFPEFEILYNTDEQNKKVAETIQHMWQKGLGLRVKLLNQEWKVFLSTQSRVDYDVSRSSWVVDVDDPLQFLEAWRTGDIGNRTGFANATFDELVEKVRREANPKTREELVAKAEALLMEEMPAVPLWSGATYYLMNPKVKGFMMNLHDLHPLKLVSIP